MKSVKIKYFLIFLYLLAVFSVIGYSVYHKNSVEVMPATGVGHSNAGATPFKGGSCPAGKFSVISEAPLVVIADEFGGIVPDDHVKNNIAAYYADYQVAVGETSNGFIVMPTPASSSGYLTVDGEHHSINTPHKFAWRWGTELQYFGNSSSGFNWDGAIVTPNIAATKPATHLFKEQIRALYQSGSIAGVKSNWRGMITDAKSSQSKSLWRWIADGMPKGNAVQSPDVIERINQYMHNGETGDTAYDYDHMSEWTETQQLESWLDTVDIYMTIVASVKDSDVAFQVWSGILDGYLTDGVKSSVEGQTLNKYNLILTAGAAIVDNDTQGMGKQILVTGQMDLLEWIYQTEEAFRTSARQITSESPGKAVVLAAENLGVHEAGNDQSHAYLRTGLSASIKSKPLIATNYPFSFGVNVRGYAISPILGGCLYQINEPDNWDMGDASHYWRQINYLSATSNGTTYYGKNFIIPSPMPGDIGVDSPALDATFSVIWDSHQSSHFVEDVNSATVTDNGQLKVRFTVQKDALASYLNMLDQYSTYYISFNIVSNNDKVLERSTRKTGEGESAMGGGPSFKINGSYNIGQRIPIGKEVLRQLLLGNTTYNAILDTSTNGHAISPDEIQKYAYDLQAVIHYGEENHGASYYSSWTGYSYDTTAAEKAKHKITVTKSKPGIEGEYMSWHSDPEAYAEIKEGYVSYTGTNSVEAFEAMAGVPSTEMLYFASGGSEFIVELELKLYKGELGMRTYTSAFAGTECEFMHQDGFWPMSTWTNEVMYSEDVADNNTEAPAMESQEDNLKTGTATIKKFFTANEFGDDLGGENRYQNKEVSQVYNWAIPGRDVRGSNTSDGSVTYNVDLNGHTHSNDHSNPDGDKAMESSTIYATYTGTVPNMIKDHSPEETNGDGNSWFDSYLEADPSPDCQGGHDGYAGHAYMGNDRTKWDATSLIKALEQAREWAAAYERTNQTYTAYMKADSDGYERIWRIGTAKITVSVGTSGASGAGTNAGNTSAINGEWTTTQIQSLIDTISANQEGQAGASFFGSGHSLNEGSDGTAGTHGDSGGPPVEPHGEDEDGTPTVPSTISQTPTINYTVAVTFDNNVLTAHELCGPCCTHLLPWITDDWAQTFQYDYAALNVCRVYKIHRSYLKGGDLEEITFADYNQETSAEASKHWMYSGPIQNYTIDNGNWSSSSRFPVINGFTYEVDDIGLRNAKRARQLITAAEQSHRHNGTDTIVAAVNQGDPNIFYNIGMMFNIHDGNNRSYAYEVVQQEALRANEQAVDLREYSKQTSHGGRTRFSFLANQMNTVELWESSQRGDYTNHLGSGDIDIPVGRGWNGPFGSRSSKCDGCSKCIAPENPIQTSSNGHKAPTMQRFEDNYTHGGSINSYAGTITFQSMFGVQYNTADPWKSFKIPNYSTGILYSRSPWTAGSVAGREYPGNLGNVGSQSFTLATDNGGNTVYTANGTYYSTFDEFWFATTTVSDDYSCTSLVYPGTAELNGGGTWVEGQGHKYHGDEDIHNYEKMNTDDSAKSGYTYDSIDYFDYLSEEYHRFRYRRNMRNTLYVISDMLILQTTSGDQPVMYHWKSQTKRLQQHYDYVEADVDARQVQFDSQITGRNILLREEGLESIWEEQHSSERTDTDGAVTRSAAGWSSNNIGTPDAVNVGGYLGLYQYPDRKFSAFVNNDRISTLFDGDPYDSAKASGGISSLTGNKINNITGIQGNDTGHVWTSSVMRTFNETAVNYPVQLGTHYANSPEQVASTRTMDFGGNKKEIAHWATNSVGGQGLSFVREGGVFRAEYAEYARGPENLWRYATTVDNLNPDMYKSNAAAHGRNWGENSTQIPAGLRMTRPAAAMRIVTDKIQINPVISNGEYDTGRATQTYMKILDYPFVDIGEMNYVDALAGGGVRDVFKTTGNQVQIEESDVDDHVLNYQYIFEDVKINITDEDDIRENGSKFNDGYFAKYPSTKKANGDTFLWNMTNGYELEATYSKTHSKINNILIHTPISVENAIIRHNEKSSNMDWYADTRTGADILTTVGLNNFVQTLEKCSGDPDTCQFHILDCKYGSDKVLFLADFNEDSKNTILNKATNTTITIPDGFEKVTTITQYKREVHAGYNIATEDPDYLSLETQEERDAYLNKYFVVQAGEKYYEAYEGGLAGGANRYGFSSDNGTFMSCFGNRLSIPLDTVGNSDRVEVEMDFYANWRSRGKFMIVSFKNYGFIVDNPYENRWGFALGESGGAARITDRYYNPVFNSGSKLKFILDLGDPSQSELWYNGVKVETRTVVNNWGGTAATQAGHLNIGSWDINNKYPAQFWIDNLKITKLAGERRHTSACYTYTFEHEKGIQYTCGIQKTIKFNPDVTGVSFTGNSTDTDRPYIYTAKEGGTYRIEAWGAAGGGATNAIGASSSGGLGGFSSGYVHLSPNESIMIYPGQKGTEVKDTGWLYAWTVTNNCYLQGGNDSGIWAEYCKEQGVQGVNWDKLDNIYYTNSKTGVTESPQSLYVIYSSTCPPKYTCGAHSISIAMRKNAAGEMEMVRREKGGAGSGGTFTTTIEHKYPYNISPSGTGRYVLARFESPMTGEVTFNVETVNWHANWYAIYEGDVENSSQKDTGGSIASSENIHLTYDQSKSKVTANLQKGMNYTFCVISKCGLFTANNGAVTGTVILYETQVHHLDPEPIDTIGGAGFNGGGSGGVNGYGGGGGTDIRRLSVGGAFTLPGYNGDAPGTLPKMSLSNTFGGSSGTSDINYVFSDARLLQATDTHGYSSTGLHQDGNTISLGEEGDPGTALMQFNSPTNFESGDTLSFTYSQGQSYGSGAGDINSNVSGYFEIGYGPSGTTGFTAIKKYTPPAGTMQFTAQATDSIDCSSIPANNVIKFKVTKTGQNWRWILRLNNVKLTRNAPAIGIIYGPYIDLTPGTYQVDIYGTTAQSKMGISCAEIDVYDNNATSDGKGIIYTTGANGHGIEDIKRSATHISFYFTLKDDHPAVSGGGIEVRLKGVSSGGETINASKFGFTELYISRLEDRIITAGGGGGADNGYGVANGNDDGSGGDGGGSVAGAAKADGLVLTGQKLSADLSDSAINARRDSDNRGWRAIDGVARSGCGLGGTQTSGYAFGRGETISFNTDTGGAGGGWYGGYVTNHNNAGAGGGSGYVNNTEASSGMTSVGGNKDQGKVTIQLVQHEHTNATSHAFDYTGDVQTWTVDETGEYLLEAWGAQGGMYNQGFEGGKGAYAANIYNLTQGQTLYIYVGGKGLSYPQNSGGVQNPTASKGFSYGGAGNGGGGNGGDASDVRINGQSYSNRILVAGGGGGADYQSRGGIGGALVGGSSNTPDTNQYDSITQSASQEARGGSQTSGGAGAIPVNTSTYQQANGSFGYGGGKTGSTHVDGGGGGGGYYGGGAGNNGHSGGAGGSSYVGALTPKKYYRMADGLSLQPGKGMNASRQFGNTGNGYVRITRVTRGHTEECQSETSEYNVHLHDIDCLYTDPVDKTDATLNSVLAAALRAEYYGDGSQLRQYLGDAVYDALHSSTEYTLNNFGPTNTRGLTTRAYTVGEATSPYGTGILYGDNSGILHFVPDRGDNWVALFGSISPNVRQIQVELRYVTAAPNKATLFWKSSSSGYSESTAINVTPAQTTDWQTLTFNTNFTGTVERLRFDLDNSNANVAKEIQIKSIKFIGSNFVPGDMRADNNILTLDYTTGIPSTVPISGSQLTQNSANGIEVSQANNSEFRILTSIPANTLKFVRITFNIPAGTPTTGWQMGLAGHWSKSTTTWNYEVNPPVATSTTSKGYVAYNTSGVVKASLYQTPANTHADQTLTYYVADAFAGNDLDELLVDAISGNVSGKVNIKKIELIGYADAGSRIEDNTVYNYTYTGAVQTFTVPEYEDGLYKLETWGANGGDGRKTNSSEIIAGSGGKGGYTTALKNLAENQKLYIYVGGKGGDAPIAARSFGQGGWNGGAPGGTELAGENSPENGAGGGGMTHISEVGTDKISSVGNIVTQSIPCGDSIQKEDLVGAGAYGYKGQFKADAPSTTTTITTTNTHLTQYIIVDTSMSSTNGFNTAWLTNKKSDEIGAWLTQKLSLSNVANGEVIHNGVSGNGVWGSGTAYWLSNPSLGIYCSDGRHGCSTYTFAVNFQTGHNYALIAYSACGAFNAANGGTCKADFTLQKYIMSVTESSASDFHTNNFIIGAGGGGGAVSYMNSLGNTKALGGNGGGASGTKYSDVSTPGTQTSGYKQGIGKAGFSPSSDDKYSQAGSNASIAGGGGGWYGGTSVDSLEPGEAAPDKKGGGGAGGSGHINASKVESSGSFTAVGGTVSNPNTSGNGYARITKINSTYITNSSNKTQDLILKSQSALVTDPNNLSDAVTKIAEYLSYNTKDIPGKPTIPDTIGSGANPIYSCYNHPLNYHECTANCKYTKSLDCHEPHHENAHYETLAQALDAIYYSIKAAEVNAVYEQAISQGRQASESEINAAVARADATWSHYDKSTIRSCYEACNNDENHKHNTVTVDEGTAKIGDYYINTDEYYDIYYPNTGDFEEDPTLHGIPAITNTRGMGYTDDMDTARYEYPSKSQNYGYTVNWVRERYVQFSWDCLFYRAETGLWEQYLANHWIEIPVEGNENNSGYAYDTFDKYGHYVSQRGEYSDHTSSYSRPDTGGRYKTSGFHSTGRVFDNTLYGHPLYHFYCTLNNEEAAAAPYIFESEAINSRSTPNPKNKYYAKDTYEYDVTDYGRSGNGIPVYENLTKEYLYTTPQDRYERVVHNAATNKLVPNAIDEHGRPYHNNDNDNRSNPTNKTRYQNHDANHGATKTMKVDVVGRVGNFMITYTNDPNYSNLFKRVDKTKPMIIEGVVYDIFEGIQRDYQSYHYNNGKIAYDVRHRQVARDTAYYNTWGSSLFKGASKSDDYTDHELLAEKQNKDDLSLGVTLSSVGAADNVQAGNDPMTAPLTSNKNNIEQLKKYELTRGYELFYELTSTGNYQNRADVKTYFYSLNTETGAIQPVDVWYISDEQYLGINFFGAADNKPLTGLSVVGDLLQKTPSGGETAKLSDEVVQKNLNSYDININWKKEADLRMYNHMEKALTEYVSANMKEYYRDDDKAYYYWNDVPEGTEPKPLRIPAGEYFRLGNLQALSVNSRGRSFIGTRYTMYESFKHKYTSSHQIHETNLFDLVDDIEYIYHAQRWHFKLSLPKSAVFVPVTDGVHHHPMEEITTTEYVPEGEKIFYYQIIDHNKQATSNGLILETGENDGHYKVFATVNIKTIGTVWNLYYTQAKKLHYNEGSYYQEYNETTHQLESKVAEEDTYIFDRNHGDQGVVDLYFADNDSSKVYGIDTNFIGYTTGKLQDSQVILAFFVDSGKVTTPPDEGENEVIATH